MDAPETARQAVVWAAWEATVGMQVVVAAAALPVGAVVLQAASVEMAVGSVTR